VIGADITLAGAERDYLESKIRALSEEVFVDGLGRDHFLDLDRNEETEADWREFMRRTAEQETSVDAAEKEAAYSP
jgi:hypothetical protein